MDLSRVYQALKNADAAGDTKAATELATFIRTQQQAEADDVRRLQKEYGPGVLGTFGRGVKRGAGQLASTFTDIIPAMAGSALGYDDYAKEQLAEAEGKRAAREAESPTMFRSYKEVEGIGDFPKFVAETVGEQVPNILTSLIPGVGAGALAARAGIGAVGKAAAVGAGTYLGSYSQNAPEIFQNIYENTKQLEPGASIIWGAGSAALDSVLPARLAKQLTGPMKMGIVEKILEKSGMDKSLLRSVTAGMATAAPMEGLTEGAQEAISIAAEKFVSDNPQIFGSKEWDRIMNSAVKGAVGGGAFGTVGGASAYGQTGAQRRAEYADALERRGERQQAAEIRRQDAEIGAIQAQNPQMDLPGFEAGPASGLYTPPASEPAGPKELKGKQAELFTPEGELTPGVAKVATRDEKIEANKQRQEAQRQAIKVKEDQAKLKKFLSAKQTTLPGFDEASIKDLQIQTAAQQQAAVESGQSDLFAPQPTALNEAEYGEKTSAFFNRMTDKEVENFANDATMANAFRKAAALESQRRKTLQPIQPATTPAVAPQVQPAPPSTLLNDEVLKDMGIGHTSLIRRNKILEGKDIANPEDAVEVKRILEAYVENRSQPIREKVETFLARPEFQGEANAARPDTTTGGGGPSVVSEPVPAGVAQANETFDGSRDVSADQNVGDVAVREGQQPPALEAAPVETLIETPTEVVAEPQQLGKRAQKDLAKAEAGAAASQQEQATFVQEVDQNVDSILTSRLREAGREAGLNDADLPSETYRGSDAHSLLRLPPLLAQYRDSEQLAQKSAGTPQETKNLQQMQQIEQEVAKSGPDALTMFQQLRDLPINQQDQMLSQVNRLALQEFDKTAQETVAKVQAEIGEQVAASKADPEGAAADAFSNALYEKTGVSLYSTPEQTKAREEAQSPMNERVNREINRLPEKQKQAMEEEYQAPRDSEQFLRRVKEDVVALVVRGANAVAKNVRAAIKKISEGVLAVAIVFNPNITLSNFSFDLPKAYSQTVTQTVQIKDQVPNEAIAKMSTLAQLVYENMAPTAKKSGKGFIIADKPNGMVHFFNANGSVLVQDAALYGKNTGDKLGRSSLQGGPKITPAGQFELVVSDVDGYAGGKLLKLKESRDLKDGTYIAIHAAYLGDAKEKRAERLQTIREGRTADSKISYGCINTAHDTFLNKVLPSIDAFNGGMLFVLPDAKETTTSMFPGKTKTETKTFTGFEKTAKTPANLHGVTARDEKAMNRERAPQQEQVTRLFLPAYQGPTFSATETALARSGNLNGLLRNVLDQIKDPDIKQVLRRLRSLNLKTKIVIAPVEGGKAGSYDPATNTITLDPQNGLNAHTFIHESLHAAISNVLASPNHPLTKEFTKFFTQIQDRMGAAYGAQDLQEFAAELVGNPSFQALLKTIKTPKSDSLFKNIMSKIAEFFGFTPKTTAFDTGLKFINSAIDISGDVQPTASEKMFLGTGNFSAVSAIGRAMPSLTGRAVESTKNFLSNLEGSGVQGAAFGLMRLDHINDIYKKELPSIQSLLNALEKRNGTQERMIKTVNSNYHDFRKVEQKYRPQMQRMSDIAIDARLAQVDLLNPNFKPDASNMAEYTRLSTAFRSLPQEVQGVYRTIRQAYDGSFNQYMKILKDAANSVSPSLAARLNEQFTAQKPLVGYVPFLRSGDFWVEFTDPKTGEPAAQAFDSLRERQQFIDTALKGIPNRAYQNLEDARFTGEGLPPTSFIMQVMNGMRNNKATQQQLDAVYQAYLTTFPAQSIMKQFMKAKNVAGMERDIISGYGDVMVRWSRKLANSEYVPQIDRALNQIKQEAGAYGDNPTINAAAQNILDQSAFFHNPSFGTFISAATTLSYAEYILGNISSALINITSLPMMVYPMLTGKYGWADATAAMTAAGKTAMNDWGKNARYKNLYNTLMDHAQLEHTMAREVLEGRRQKTSDYLGVKARILDGLSIPFAATEKYNRGVTAIAAYDLARKSGMNEEKAVRYALDTVKNVHTSGLAATGPKWMQTPMGRLFFTFKSFVWNSAYVMARAFHQSFKGETPEIRKAAQRQLLATYGMATVFTGIKGMPFYGAVSVLAQMINSLFGDEEEPFDFDEFLRDIFGEFFYKGAFNYATNIEIANRAGIATDLLFRDDPRGVAEHGYVLSAMQQAFGPAGTIAVNSGNAFKMMQDGHVERAIETIAPSFVRNFMKGTRYMIEGATTLKGDSVMEDISAYNSLMQGIGFTPADLSSQYERMQAAKGYEREVLARRTKLLQAYDMGHTAGDFDLMSETTEKMQAFNEAHTNYRITPDTIKKSIRARKAAEKEMVNGVRFNKKLRAEIEDKFFDEE